MRFLIPLSVASRRAVRPVELMAVFLLMVAVYLACILASPVRQPACADEFAYLFSAKLMANGHLSLPAEPDAAFFQTYYILEEPARVGRFHPGQSASLALGILAGSPLFGVLLTLACGMTTFYMLLRVVLGVLVSLITSLAFAVAMTSGYWAHSYWGGGVPMLGAMMFLYAIFATMRERRGVVPWSREVFGVLGIVLMALSRPFEGAMFVAMILAASCVVERLRSCRRMMWCGGLVSGVILAAYNFSVMGSVLAFPYWVYESEWCRYPIFLWQHAPDAGLPSVGIPILDMGRQSLHETATWLELVLSMPGRMIVPFAYVFGNCTVILVVFGLMGTLRFGSLRWLLPAWCGLICVATIVRAWHPHYAAPWFPLMMFCGILFTLSVFRRYAAVVAAVLSLAWFVLGGTAQYPESNVARLMRESIAVTVDGSERTMVFVEPPDSARLASQVVLDNPPDRATAPCLLVNLLGADACDRFCATHPDRRAYVLRFVRSESGVTAAVVPYADYRKASYAKFPRT